MTNIRWPLIAMASASGLLFAALTIFAVISGYEGVVALITIVGIGKLMGFMVEEAPVRHALLGGFLAGLLAVGTQAAFLPLYFENNPTYAQLPIPFGLSARTYTAIVAPLGGLIAGCLAGLVAWPMSAVARRWRARRPHVPPGDSGNVR